VSNLGADGRFSGREAAAIPAGVGDLVYRGRTADYPLIPMVTDLDVVAALADELQADYETPGPDPWAESSFRWIRDAASARKGAVGKELFRRWAQQEGFDVRAKRRGTPADCVVNGLDVVVKTGLLWAEGVFRFEQIRHQDYDSVALLALAPHSVCLWIVPIDELWACSEEQHGADTHWLSFAPGSVPAVLTKYGGALQAASAALLEQTLRKRTGG